MDGESYEDPQIAEFLNRHFTCIKVDRDERPDVDVRYQRAVQAILARQVATRVITPEGESSGGTFPARRQVRRPVPTVLERSAVYLAARAVEQQAGPCRMLAEQLDEA
jgi:uncharacterized protein YyaL (SSP411 family)